MNAFILMFATAHFRVAKYHAFLDVMRLSSFNHHYSGIPRRRICHALRVYYGQSSLGY